MTSHFEQMAPSAAADGLRLRSSHCGRAMRELRKQKEIQRWEARRSNLKMILDHLNSQGNSQHGPGCQVVTLT